MWWLRVGTGSSAAVPRSHWRQVGQSDDHAGTADDRASCQRAHGTATPRGRPLMSVVGVSLGRCGEEAFEEFGDGVVGVVWGGFVTAESVDLVAG